MAQTHERVSQDRVAQLDSALDFESNGCGFESRHGCKSEAMAQLAARRIPDPKVGGSNPSSLIFLHGVRANGLEV